jgi:hypothetical protein
MSDATATTPRPESNSVARWPTALFTHPSFATQYLTLPIAFRDLIENSTAQVKENFDILRGGGHIICDFAEQSYSDTIKSFSDLTLKLFDVARVNADAAFDFAGQLMAAKSPWEVGVLSMAHAQRQVAGISAQSKEIVTLAQRLATKVDYPLAMCRSPLSDRSERRQKAG